MPFSALRSRPAVRVLRSRVVVLLVVLAGLWAASPAQSAVAALPASGHTHASYVYDPSGPVARTVTVRVTGQPSAFELRLRPVTRFVVAAKAGDDVAYHCTFREAAASIERHGLRPGSYATPNGTLSPLQAQIDLALPPNRGLTSAVLRVDLAGLRKAGYEIPTVTRVGRSFNMPGGGYELKFPYEVPPECISVVSR
jgi:hypothetical protein